MEIKVLGAGCSKCRSLMAETEKAVAQAGLLVKPIKVESLPEIMSFGVMATPALVIDGAVKCAGRVPKLPEIISWLTDAASQK
jgi:small redox-active disulfide protein 2